MLGNVRVKKLGVLERGVFGYLPLDATF